MATRCGVVLRKAIRLFLVIKNMEVFIQQKLSQVSLKGRRWTRAEGHREESMVTPQHVSFIAIWYQKWRTGRINPEPQLMKVFNKLLAIFPWSLCSSPHKWADIHTFCKCDGLKYLDSRNKNNRTPSFAFKCLLKKADIWTGEKSLCTIRGCCSFIFKVFDVVLLWMRS